MLTSTIKYKKSSGNEQTGSYNSEFLAALSAFGNQIMCRIYIEGDGEHPYLSNTIRTVRRYGVVNLLKSIMYAYEIRIDQVVDLTGSVISDLQFGVSEDGEDYYLVSFGSCTITESKTDIAGGFTTLTAYDGMLKAMSKFETIEIAANETNYSYFEKLAAVLELGVGNSIPETGVMAIPMISNGFTDKNTYRDILDDYSEILGGCIAVKNDTLELLKPAGVPIATITRSNLKKFTPKDVFPAVDNVIVTASEASGAYMYNEVTEGTIINIKNNKLLDTSQITSYLSEMFESIADEDDGWGAYTPIEAESHGYFLYEPCDVVSFDMGGATPYRVIWLSNDITIGQGISETINCDYPVDREDDYFKSDQQSITAVTLTDITTSEMTEVKDDLMPRINGLESDSEEIGNKYDYLEALFNELQQNEADSHASIVNVQSWLENNGDSITAFITGWDEENNQTVELAKTFLNEDGLNVETAGATTTTRITGDGLQILATDESHSIIALFASDIVAISRLKATEELRFGAHQVMTTSHVELEDLIAGTSSETDGTGWFWVGDVS